jgi:hypothetical protein
MQIQDVNSDNDIRETLLNALMPKEEVSSRRDHGYLSYYRREARRRVLGCLPSWMPRWHHRYLGAIERRSLFELLML